MPKLSPATLTNALAYFNGSDQVYPHSLLRTFSYTEGVQFLAENAGAYWLLDLIFSHQLDPKVAREEFQVWILKVENQRGVVICEDGNGNKVAEQVIEYTDFPLREISLWLENQTLMLPSER